METINIKPIKTPSGTATQLILNVASSSLPFLDEQVLTVGVGITDSSGLNIWGCSVSVNKEEYELWNSDTYLIDLCIVKANEKILNGFVVEKV